MRLFTAIFPGENVKYAIARQYGSLVRRYGEALRWVEPEKWHLTLQFLGQVSDDVALKVISGWSSMPLDLSHLEISLSSWGCFPDIGPERVLWIGVDVNSTAWRSLLSSIANYLAFFDIQVDTGNSIPHITVGRVRRPNQVRGLREQIGQLKVASESCSIETLELVESMQSKDGSIYRVRASKRIEGRVG